MILVWNSNTQLTLHFNWQRKLREICLLQNFQRQVSVMAIHKDEATVLDHKGQQFWVGFWIGKGVVVRDNANDEHWWVIPPRIQYGIFDYVHAAFLNNSGIVPRRNPVQLNVPSYTQYFCTSDCSDLGPCGFGSPVAVTTPLPAGVACIVEFFLISTVWANHRQSGIKMVKRNSTSSSSNNCLHWWERNFLPKIKILL